jgi:hypothetical protein
MSEDVAWEPVDDYEQWWKPFDERFSFRANVKTEGWPAIREPIDSVTFSLEPVCQTGSEAKYVAGTDAINAEVLRAFVDVFEQGERLVVLDWQHQGYYFRPHLHAAKREQWLVTPVPDGDYYVFLAEGLATGTFGHPWEESLCVFGGRLVETLAPTLEAWLPVLRRGGMPT